MTYSDWKTGEDDGQGPLKGKRRWSLVLAVLGGFGAAGALAMVAMPKAGWSYANPRADLNAIYADEAQQAAVAADHDSVTDIGAYRSSGSVAEGEDWVFDPSFHALPMPRFADTQPAPQAPAMADTSRMVPLPVPNPLVAMRTQPVPLPLRRPAILDDGKGAPQVASLPPSEQTQPKDAPKEQPLKEPPASEGVALPTPGSGYALYDITGQTVYLPNGEQLEAHSGYGDKFDDPKYAHVRMLGPTPPNTYKLTMREALFHGVEALRMHPVGSGKMYGRTGILTHSYLLGPRGDSNGCISFKDYGKFLAAYKRGEVQHMVVVASLPNAPSRNNNLLSWLMPKRSSAQ